MISGAVDEWFDEENELQIDEASSLLL